MFNKNFKLIYTAIGLVAVLMMGLILPGIGQPAGCPPLTEVPCIDRAKVVQGLQNAFAALTASTEDLLDFEKAVYWSDGGPRQIAYIPPHPASGFWDSLQRLRAGEKVDVPFGGLYVVEDAKAVFKLKKLPAALKLRLRGDDKRVAFINSEGDVVMTRPVREPDTLPDPLPNYVPFSVEIRFEGGFCVSLRIAGYDCNRHTC